MRRHIVCVVASVRATCNMGKVITSSERQWASVARAILCGIVVVAYRKLYLIHHLNSTLAALTLAATMPSTCVAAHTHMAHRYAYAKYVASTACSAEGEITVLRRGGCCARQQRLLLQESKRDSSAQGLFSADKRLLHLLDCCCFNRHRCCCCCCRCSADIDVWRCKRMYRHVCATYTPTQCICM